MMYMSLACLAYHLGPNVSQIYVLPPLLIIMILLAVVDMVLMPKKIAACFDMGLRKTITACLVVVADVTVLEAAMISVVTNITVLQIEEITVVLDMLVHEIMAEVDLVILFLLVPVMSTIAIGTTAVAVPLWYQTRLPRTAALLLVLHCTRTWTQSTKLHRNTPDAVILSSLLN
eukprot:scaffold17685_cov169-Amphora_coffeaeformis.AAC.5